MTTLLPDDSLHQKVPLLATFPRLPAERNEPVEILPSTGTVDDDDNPNDEHGGENEAPERGEEDTELPEELEIDGGDDPGHSEDDDADEDHEHLPTGR